MNRFRLAVITAVLGVSLALVPAADAGKRTARDLDGDGTPNTRDKDIDGDRKKNGKDRDIDGDGKKNVKDPDMDADRKKNGRDPDMDADGIPNVRDEDPDADGRRGVRAPLQIPRPRSARVDPSFFGLVNENAMAAAGGGRSSLMVQSAATGAGTFRQTFKWSEIETRPGRYEFGNYDDFVGRAAHVGMTVLPILFDPPAWHALSGSVRGAYPPASNEEFGHFAQLLVRRYGPDGSYWREHPSVPRMPVRAWQVWNEPNLPHYWPAGVNPAEYAAMLRAVSTAIKALDSGAEIVTAGIPESRTGMPLTRFLAGMYRAGARGSFDTLAINPYATTPEGVLENFTSARALLDKNRDRRAQIWGTEIGWSTAGPRNPFRVSEAEQAVLIRRTLQILVGHSERLRIRGLVYFNWADAPPYEGGQDFWGLHTGLLKQGGGPKSSFQAFAETIRSLVR